MSAYITDVSNWKNYSFLNNVWNIYDEFNSTVAGDRNNHLYGGVCEGIVKNYGAEKDRHKDFCMKLVRNLGCYNLKTKYHKPNNDRCIILYNWIHNTKKNYIHSDEIITKCFNDYFDFMVRTVGNYICSYDLYNAIYADPIKMTILDIFNDNIHNIITKLMDEPEKDKFSAKNFVCESVNIYKEMYKHYCNDPRARDTENKKTCDHLNIIKTIYNQYLLKEQVLKNKIPSLDGSDKEFWDKCKADEKLSEIPVVRVPEAPRMQYLDEGSGEDIPQEMPYKEDYDENKVSPMARSVSTAVGTVAGASSVLALLYKVNEEFHLNFSPARRLVHSRFRGNTGRMNSNLYGNEPNELLFDGFQGEDMSSHNTRYNIGYGSV